MNLWGVIIRLMSGLTAFAAGISIAAAVVNHEDVTVPPPPIPIDVAGNWRRIIAGTVSFSIPPAMQQRAVHSSCGPAWEFQDDSLKLSVHSGSHTDDLTYYVEQPSYRAEAITIDGKDARLVTFRQGGDLPEHFTGAEPYVVAAYFPRENNFGGSTLTMWADCESMREREMAKQVFLTAKFNR